MKVTITCKCGEEVDASEFTEKLNILMEANKEVEALRYFKENVFHFMKSVQALE